MTDKMDPLIKNYLKNRKLIVSRRRDDAGYPSFDVFYSYLTDALEAPELERMLAFLRNDPEAQELVSKARQMMDSESGWENEEVPAALVQRAKSLMRQKSAAGQCPHCGKPITPFKRPLESQQWKNALWFGLAALSFALSFVAHRYFYQFLAATLLFGFKGVVDQRATKTQIMVYKALSEDADSTHSRVHQTRH